jgi:hypothetical protein
MSTALSGKRIFGSQTSPETAGRRTEKRDSKSTFMYLGRCRVMAYRTSVISIPITSRTAIAINGFMTTEYRSRGGGLCHELMLVLPSWRKWGPNEPWDFCGIPGARPPPQVTRRELAYGSATHSRRSPMSSIRTLSKAGGDDVGPYAPDGQQLGFA